MLELSPSRYFLSLLCLALLALAGCSSKTTLVVYSDPWLRIFSGKIEEAFEKTHPECDLQVKEISSEVIAQHIHFGQPIDVFLCFGKPFLKADVQEMLGQEVTLASTKIQLLQGAEDAQQKTLKTEGCTVVEASGRPLRNYSELGFSRYFQSDSCRMVADFPAQTKDYLLRHWVKRGFAPQHFSRQNMGKFEIVAEGPLIVNAFCAIQLKNAPHPKLAADLMRMLSSVETKKILGDLGYVP